MTKQTDAGKAFEYALIKQSYNLLSKRNTVKLIENNSYFVAKKCYDLFTDYEKDNYIKAANAGILHIIELEPKLDYSKSISDILSLQLVPDSMGIKGDVRDVLFIRSSQNWEIGISAKNNNKAVKHSRLSEHIDFGKEWLDINCSRDYFTKISPIFNELENLKKNNCLWRSLEQKHDKYYLPILSAFQNELLRLESENPSQVSERLLQYLIGSKDFYKVIKGRNRTEVYGFNIKGTLNKSVSGLKPKDSVNKLKLPNRIVELKLKPNSKNTLLLICNEGWQISFRIHNASSKVEPSLKFDINLIGQPQSLYSHHISWH
jgi:hypothetical protein